MSNLHHEWILSMGRSHIAIPLLNHAIALMCVSIPHYAYSTVWRWCTLAAIYLPLTVCMSSFNWLIWLLSHPSSHRHASILYLGSSITQSVCHVCMYMYVCVANSMHQSVSVECPGHPILFIVFLIHEKVWDDDRSIQRHLGSSVC